MNLWTSQRLYNSQACTMCWSHEDYMHRARSHHTPIYFCSYYSQKFPVSQEGKSQPNSMHQVILAFFMSMKRKKPKQNKKKKPTYQKTPPSHNFG